MTTNQDEKNIQATPKKEYKKPQVTENAVVVRAMAALAVYAVVAAFASVFAATESAAAVAGEYSQNNSIPAMDEISDTSTEAVSDNDFQNT